MPEITDPNTVVDLLHAARELESQRPALLEGGLWLSYQEWAAIREQQTAREAGTAPRFMEPMSVYLGVPVHLAGCTGCSTLPREGRPSCACVEPCGSPRCTAQEPGPIRPKELGEVVADNARDRALAYGLQLVRAERAVTRLHRPSFRNITTA